LCKSARYWPTSGLARGRALAMLAVTNYVDRHRLAVISTLPECAIKGTGH
jgi:hypothetical protein